MPAFGRVLKLWCFTPLQHTFYVYVPLTQSMKRMPSFASNSRSTLTLLGVSCREAPGTLWLGLEKNMCLDCSFRAGKHCDSILISCTLLPNEPARYKIDVSTGGTLPTGYLSVFLLQSVRCLGNGTKVFSS